MIPIHYRRSVSRSGCNNILVVGRDYRIAEHAIGYFDVSDHATFFGKLGAIDEHSFSAPSPVDATAPTQTAQV